MVLVNIIENIVKGERTPDCTFDLSRTNSVLLGVNVSDHLV